MPDEQRDPQTYAIIGAAMEVHRHLGPGFLEAVYQEALAIEFDLRKIPFLMEKPLRLEYKGIKMVKEYRADFICFDSIIIELKAMQKIGAIEEAQLLHYLKVTKLNKGLLINFSSKELEYKRFVN